jgi:curli biogenesis system outer membrane secretion channel CsgG
MKQSIRRIASSTVLAGLLLALSASRVQAGGSTADGDDPQVDNSRTSQALRQLPRKPLAERLAVTIYEFRSAVPQVTAAAAADMFTTALIDSGQFRVVERAELNQTVLREKQLNAAGQATGTAAQKQLRGAQYIFEGTVSEANGGQSQQQGGLNIGGLTLGGSRNEDSIAVDVRILDADTGDVLDSIAVRKAVRSSGSSLGGTAAFASTVASLMGKTVSPLTPDVNVQNTRTDSVNEAMRACIESSVIELIKDLSTTTAASISH